MISPSPEFPVTKVGMSNRRRDKPLLTSGRRPSTTPEAPLSKKRKTAHDPTPASEEKRQCSTPTLEGKSSESTRQDEETLQEEHKQAEDAPKVKKGSIMSFFKPLPPKATATDTELKAEPAEEDIPSSSAPSPTEKQKRRTPRLLRLRPTLPVDDLIEEGKENQQPFKNDTAQSSDHQPVGNAIGPTKNQKPKSAPSIQTTLNISSRAAFSQCRLCDTVWNPSHADDVKYHKRRHAAVVRRRQLDRSTGS